MCPDFLELKKNERGPIVIVMVGADADLIVVNRLLECVREGIRADVLVDCDAARLRDCAAAYQTARSLALLAADLAIFVPGVDLHRFQQCLQARLGQLLHLLDAPATAAAAAARGGAGGGVRGGGSGPPPAVHDDEVVWEPHASLTPPAAVAAISDAPPSPPASHPLLPTTSTTPAQVKHEIISAAPPVVGCRAARDAIEDCLRMTLAHSVQLTGIRAPPRSVLLHGPPGCGKTSLVASLALKYNLPVFKIEPSTVLSKWSGESEQRLTAIFEAAVEAAPSIVFIDEMDGLCLSRGAADGVDGAARRLLAVFLMQLGRLTDTAPSHPDGSAEDPVVVMVVGATNRLDDVDPAIQRRFARRIEVGFPNRPTRLRMVQTFLAGVRTELSEQEMAELVAPLEGWSGSDLFQLCREAAMGPVRRKYGAVENTGAGEQEERREEQREVQQEEGEGDAAAEVAAEGAEGQAAVAGQDDSTGSTGHDGGAQGGAQGGGAEGDAITAGREQVVDPGAPTGSVSDDGAKCKGDDDGGGGGGGGHAGGSDTDDADDSGTDDGLTVTRLDFEQALQLVRPVTLAA